MLKPPEPSVQGVFVLGCLPVRMFAVSLQHGFDSIDGAADLELA